MCQSTSERAPGRKSCPKENVAVEKRDVSTSSKHVFNEEGSGGVEQLQLKGVIVLGWQWFIWEGPGWDKDRKSPGTATGSHFSMARPSVRCLPGTAPPLQGKRGIFPVLFHFIPQETSPLLTSSIAPPPLPRANPSSCFPPGCFPPPPFPPCPCPPCPGAFRGSIKPPGRLFLCPRCSWRVPRCSHIPKHRAGTCVALRGSSASQMGSWQEDPKRCCTAKGMLIPRSFDETRVLWTEAFSGAESPVVGQRAGCGCRRHRMVPVHLLLSRCLCRKWGGAGGI